MHALDIAVSDSLLYMMVDTRARVLRARACSHWMPSYHHQQGQRDWFYKEGCMAGKTRATNTERVSSQAALNLVEDQW